MPPGIHITVLEQEVRPSGRQQLRRKRRVHRQPGAQDHLAGGTIRLDSVGHAVLRHEISLFGPRGTGQSRTEVVPPGGTHGAQP